METETKHITVAYQGRDYPVDFLLEYQGIDCKITAKVGATTLTFEPTDGNGLQNTIEGEELEQGLITQIAWVILKGLE
ncbi:hypothetical protein F0L74_09670 [Chitinophaga agrisoli]|uniref:Uncharacterized protein n=1 Tax=Chitinophaga agrisoli TaxID=2607653 RepID=A0A5B2VX62_9BACT|nr:hypothetical protein [Chitinophaga agrisoli]KAA2242786.1 hypothetical protein F0L74_09670 [Chitinophaga agrisoli]